MANDIHVHLAKDDEIRKFKCPSCGANIVEGSRVCVFCGAAVGDHVQRADIRIEDVAEVKRATYEDQESAIRQKEMTHDLRWKLFKRYFWIAWTIVAVVLFVVSIITNSHDLIWIWILMMLISAVYISIYVTLHKK